MSRVLPTFGNLVVEERPTSVALRLHTDHNGEAIFTYAEIATLISHLQTLRAPKPVEPVSAGAFD